MNSRGLVIVAVLAIAILLVGSTAFSHSAEAKKRQPSEIKVYVSNVGEISHKQLLRVCIIDDGHDCITKEKTIDLQKHSGDRKATVATYSMTFSGKPGDLAPSDILACGALNGHPHNGDKDSVCADLHKVKSKHWIAVISYRELLGTPFIPFE